MDMKIIINGEELFSSLEDFIECLKSAGIKRIIADGSTVSSETKMQVTGCMKKDEKEKLIKVFNCYEYCQSFCLTIDNKELDMEIWDFLDVINNIRLAKWAKHVKSLEYKIPNKPNSDILSMYEIDNILTIMRLFNDNIELLLEMGFFNEEDDDPFI